MLTIQELADKMRVHYQTVRSWMRRGLPVTKVGNVVRIDEKEAMEWLKAQRNKGE